MNRLDTTSEHELVRSASTPGGDLIAEAAQLAVPGWIGSVQAGDRVVSRPRSVTEADLVLFASLTGDRRASGPGNPDPTTDADRTGPLVLAYAFGLLDLDPAEVAVPQLRETTFHRRLRSGDTIHLEGDVEMVRGDETIRFLWRVMRGDGKPIARFRTEFVVLTTAATDDPPLSAFRW